MNLLIRWLPQWIQNYPRALAPRDVLAGLLVAILAIPQNLAYAMLAGLPPQAGMYASILPVIAYSIWGSSMTQAVGPVAVTAIMTSAVLVPLAPTGSAEYIALASCLALTSGLVVFACGVMRLGFLSELLSRPVVSGFITGSAFLILLSQLKPLVGWTASSHGLSPSDWLHTHGISALIGFSCLITLLATRLWLVQTLVKIGVTATRADLLMRLMPLVLVLTATLVSVYFDLDQHYGVHVVGALNVNSSMWTFAMPDWNLLPALVAPTLVMAFVGMVQNIGMAKALATKRNEQVDANRELMALGSANIVTTFCGGMPVGGGTSRSALNTAAGAQSPLASIVAALVLWIIISVGSDWFTQMPLPALAASIMVAGLSMVDFASLRKAWEYDRADAAAWIGTAFGVTVLGVQLGIALGIGLSLTSLLWRSSQPHIAVIGRIPGTEHFRNIERHGVLTLPSVLMLRVDESLFFGNMSAVQARLMAEINSRPNVRDVVLILSATNRIDATALDILSETQRNLKANNIHLHLAEVKGPVQDRLAGTPLWKTLQGRVHLSANDAFEVLGGAQSS